MKAEQALALRWKHAADSVTFYGEKVEEIIFHQSMLDDRLKEAQAQLKKAKDERNAVAKITGIATEDFFQDIIVESNASQALKHLEACLPQEAASFVTQALAAYEGTSSAAGPEAHNSPVDMAVPETPIMTPPQKPTPS